MRKETRLQSISGQIATSCSVIVVVRPSLLKRRVMEPYPVIHTFVFPAHMKSPFVAGLKWRTRCGVLVMWQVVPESRMKEFFSG